MAHPFVLEKELEREVDGDRIPKENVFHDWAAREWKSGRRNSEIDFTHA